MAGMPCDENAMCEELPKRDNFNCTCIPPYMGDGFMCSRGRCLLLSLRLLHAVSLHTETLQSMHAPRTLAGSESVYLYENQLCSA